MDKQLQKYFDAVKRAEDNQPVRIKESSSRFIYLLGKLTKKAHVIFAYVPNLKDLFK